MTFALNYHRWIVGQFAPYLGGTVAEVGAGSGSVSRLLLEKNVEQLLAFEPSDNMFPLLVKELSHEARASVVKDFFHPRHGRQRFDAVAYINVLEHIEDDRTELAHAFEALKTNGHLLLFVPALPWLYSEHDWEIGHFRRYTKRNLISLVENAGFTVVKARYFDVVGIIPWYVNFVLLRNSIGKDAVALYDRFVVPLMRRVETAIRPPIGKNVLLIGRRP
ncbi:MAG TPA: class I SAM-dependent methyltransferase [Casimicrobiaceae bacterium]|jgi:SAM-dependent methyltransferase